MCAKIKESASIKFLLVLPSEVAALWDGSMGFICNERGELLSFAFTKGNIDDRKPLEDKQFIKDIYGKLVGGGGYISKSLFRTLFVDGIHLLTRLKTNMKGSILSAGGSLLIRKRAIIGVSMTS